MQLNGVLIHPWFLTSLLLINVYNNVTVIMEEKKSLKPVLISSHMIQMGETFTGS